MGTDSEHVVQSVMIYWVINDLLLYLVNEEEFGIVLRAVYLIIGSNTGDQMVS